MSEGGGPLSHSRHNVKDKHRSEAHRALGESKSVDRVWNFAFEELGRINVNFDPAWMSGKKQIHRIHSECPLHRVCLRKLLD